MTTGIHDRAITVKRGYRKNGQDISYVRLTPRALVTLSMIMPIDIQENLDDTGKVLGAPRYFIEKKPGEGPRIELVRGHYLVWTRRYGYTVYSPKRFEGVRGW